jgi:hypothetical protein
MSAALIGGVPYDWSMGEDEEGYRDYDLLWKVETTSRADGPALARYCAGLPTPGAALSVGGLIDPWAFHYRAANAKLFAGEQSGCVWSVSTKFTNRPPKRCETNKFDNPLSEPARWRGGSVKLTEEAQKDKDGNAILNAANQRFRGPEVQTVVTHPTAELEVNCAWINIPWLGQYVEAVNDATWWGCAARTLKCTDFTWERALYGTCTYFFIARFSFEYKAETWDVSLLNEGDMVLIPGTAPPQFRRARDDTEELVRVLLDNAGNKLAAGAAPIYKTFRVKKEKDFSLVGWPATAV